MRAESNEKDSDQKPARPIVPTENQPDWHEYYSKQHGQDDIKIRAVPVSTNRIEHKIWYLVRHEKG